MGRRAVARPGVEHVAELEKRGHSERERLPCAARRVVPLEVVGDRFRKAATPFRVELLEALLVRHERGIGGPRRFFEERLHRIGDGVGRQCIEALRPLTPVSNEPRLAKAPEMGGHAGLGNARYANQVGHAELARAEQGAQAEAILVTQEVQRVGVVGELHASNY